MTISVIIPAFNEEKYLPKTLQSIKKMDRQPDEIIVVDGGSKDKTVAIAKKFGAKVIIEKKRGIGLARDRGLEGASGDIVSFTDADTIVPSNWLTKIEELFQTKDVVGTFGLFMVSDGWWLYKIYINFIQPLMIWLYFKFGIPVAPGQNMAFLRKKGITAGGFPKNFLIMEDLEMIRRLMKVGKVVFRPDLIVKSSGRRGGEGPRWFPRTFGSFLLYVFFGKAPIGFPDIR